MKLNTKEKQSIIIITFGIVFAIICILLQYFIFNTRKVNAWVYQSDNKIVTFEDETGNLWEIKNNNNYHVGEEVVLTFTDKGTDFIEDDAIIKIEYVE